MEKKRVGRRKRVQARGETIHWWGNRKHIAVNQVMRTRSISHEMFKYSNLMNNQVKVTQEATFYVKINMYSVLDWCTSVYTYMLICMPAWLVLQSAFATTIIIIIIITIKQQQLAQVKERFLVPVTQENNAAACKCKSIKTNVRVHM